MPTTLVIVEFDVNSKQINTHKVELMEHKQHHYHVTNIFMVTVFINFVKNQEFYHKKFIKIVK